MWDHFKLEEFTCKCGCGTNKMKHYVIDYLDDARDGAGVPFIITSGYRCPTYDKSLGGKGNHPDGTAVDIHCDNSKDRWLIIDNLRRCHFKRIGVSKTFIHADMNESHPQERLWVY